MVASSPPVTVASEQDRSRRPLFATRGLSFIALGLSIAAVLSSLGPLEASAASFDFDKRAFGYTMARPEAIIETVSQLEPVQEAAEDELAKLISERSNEIFNDAASPVAGNPKGDVTLVEFFDYNCPYCRKAAPIIEELARGDPNLRLVFKEFPILGPGSTFAARAALASQKQDKYLAFHNAMMAYPGSIRETSTLEVAANVGLDVARLREDMEDPAIKQSIDRNLALAEDLRITGTPSFVAGKEIARGLADLEAMKELIAKARQSKEK